MRSWHLELLLGSGSGSWKYGGIGPRALAAGQHIWIIWSTGHIRRWYFQFRLYPSKVLSGSCSPVYTWQQSLLQPSTMGPGGSTLVPRSFCMKALVTSTMTLNLDFATFVQFLLVAWNQWTGARMYAVSSPIIFCGSCSGSCSLIPS